MSVDLFNTAVAAGADMWVPACGGSETPLKTRSGARLLYCYNPALAKHAWLNCDTDIILDDNEAHLLMWGK